MAVQAQPRRAGADVVRAAGGIIVRPIRHGRFEVAVIHRPGRDDWTLPKGKLEAGESLEDCALREVLEETGFRCELHAFVGYTEYRDRRGREKVVGYWLMSALDGAFEPGDEVDVLQWLELTVAERALTYGRDAELLASLDTVALASSG